MVYSTSYESSARKKFSILERWMGLLLSLNCTITDALTVTPRPGTRRRVHSSWIRSAAAADFPPVGNELLEAQIAIIKLIRWAEEEELEGLETTCIATDTKIGLRGLFAEEDIEAGEFICAVPFTATLLVEDSLNNEKITGEFLSLVDMDPQVLIGLNFLREFACKEKWKPYIDCLPRPSHPSFHPTPDFWTESEIQQLQIPRLVDESLRRKRDIAKLITSTKDPDSVETIGDSVVDDIRMLQWATWIVRSRGFATLKVCQTQDGESTLQSRTVLLPYLDMINHDEDPNASIEVLEVPDCYDESFYALRATRNIFAGEQVTICYGTGRETSLDLFSKYGFWTTDNPADGHMNWQAVNAQWTTTLEQDRQFLLQTNDNALKQIFALRIHLKQLQLQ